MIKVFRKWGRVGTKFGGKKIDSFSNKRDALDSFQEVYLDKTGNEWAARDRFEKKPGKFFPIEIDYSGISKKGSDAKVVDIKSKLDIRVQSTNLFLPLMVIYCFFFFNSLYQI